MIIATYIVVIMTYLFISYIIGYICIKLSLDLDGLDAFDDLCRYLFRASPIIWWYLILITGFYLVEYWKPISSLGKLYVRFENALFEVD